MKHFAKPFLPVHMGPRWIFFYLKRCLKSRDNVHLTRGGEGVWGVSCIKSTEKRVEDGGGGVGREGGRGTIG